MNKIEAHDGNWIVTVDAENVPVAPVTFADIKLTYAFTEDFKSWCKERQIAVPDLDVDDRFKVFYCFPSDEDAVFFKLAWQKGCDST